MPYNRRFGPQPIGGGVGGAGPRPLCMTGSTYSSTTSLRPIPAIIWPQLAPTEGRPAPGLRAIGPVLVEICYVMPALPRAPSCNMTGSTYSPTTSLRPIATLIWPQLAPIMGTLAPNAKAIGPILVEILCHVRLPQATLYRVGSTHTTTNWLRTILTII
jgi:hypothetical protein